MKDGVVFSPADRRIAARLGRADLDAMLAHALLFEREVVIPDVYFFNSPYLLAQLKSTEMSLLEVAIETHVVQTAVREPASSFDDIHDYLRRDGVFGLMSRADCSFVAGRLGAHAKSNQFDLVWPQEMATSYGELLRRVLQDDAVPGNDENLTRVWDGTRALRHDVLDEAFTLANQRPGNYGVRRADVLRALALHVQIISENDPTPTEEEIAAAPADAEQREQLRRYIAWLDDLYFANQAQRFGYPPTCTSDSIDDLAVLNRAAAMPLAGMPESLRTLELEIDVPPISTLLHLGAHEFLGLREHGLNWYGSAHAFVMDPSNATQSAAEESLLAFSAALRRSARGVQPQRSLAKLGVGGLMTAGAAAAADVAMYTVNGPPITAIGAVLLQGWLLMAWTKPAETVPIRVARSRHTARQFVSFDPQYDL